MAFMSYKQETYLKSLLEQRVIPFELFDKASSIDYNTISVKEASSFIEILKNQPLKNPPEPESDNNGNNIKKEPAKEGFYFYNNEVYQVVASKQGHNYAKILVHDGSKGHWDYVKGMMNVLNDSYLISLAEARKFGKDHGFCMVCGRTLTDPISVQAGIGPICAERFGA